MDIPLKSLPKVSVSGVGETRLNESGELEPHSPEKGYKLARTYSETEFNNFDSETGHRLFDDGRIRSKPSRVSSPAQLVESSKRQKSLSRLYSRSHNEYINPNSGGYLKGLEDEYIPGIDFADMITRWNWSLSEQSSSAASRENSFLDLNKLHSQVAPKPIQFRKQLFQNHTHHQLPHERPHTLRREDSITEEEKPKTGLGDAAVPVPSSGADGAETPAAAPLTASHDYEAILASLPGNFSELPYSQRKKLVKSFSEEIDFSSFCKYAKSYHSNGSGSSATRTPKSFGTPVLNSSGASLRRSRRNSGATVAGRLLAMSLSSDLRKLEKPKKINVDEKGAIVLDYELGRVIGYGAWGIIRECSNKEGVVRAMKIVKSSGNETTQSVAAGEGVLQVFRKEIDIWKKLHHPSLLPLLDSVETPDTIFCLTERISGGTLFEVVSEWGMFNETVGNTLGPFSFLVEKQRQRLLETARVSKQIAEALLYLHEELGVVHGDVKLENVLINKTDERLPRIILCDFGMSRVYTTRGKRYKSEAGAKSGGTGEGATAMERSKSSGTAMRKPYNGPELIRVRGFFADDSQLGTMVRKPGLYTGPAPQSVELTPSTSQGTLIGFREYNKRSDGQQSHTNSCIESELPHLHIGSLPYASPEILSPLPPPLGPSADVWALGVLMFTMVVGKLPFQHPYEPRLRAMISAGKYDVVELEQACLLQWVSEEKVELGKSLVDMERQEQMENSKAEWENHDKEEFHWMMELIGGCLERDIVRRLESGGVVGILASHRQPPTALAGGGGTSKSSYHQQSW